MCLKKTAKKEYHISYMNAKFGKSRVVSIFLPCRPDKAEALLLVQELEEDTNINLVRWVLDDLELKEASEHAKTMIQKDTPANTIHLKDMHSEGDGSIIERSMLALYEGTKEWISFSTSDEVQKAWISELKKDPVSAIVYCYEIEQGFDPVSTLTTLRGFCEKELSCL